MATADLAESVKVAFAKRAPKVPLTVVNLKDGIPADLKADAVVLSGSLAMNPPKKAEAWIRSFSGIRLIVEDGLAGVAWMNDYGQAADSAKAMAEGQKIRPHLLQKAHPHGHMSPMFSRRCLLCNCLFHSLTHVSASRWSTVLVYLMIYF